MRYIYLDEAGTSKNEHVSVVAGVIINPDFQWRLVESEIERLRAPFAHFLDAKTALHATDIFSGKAPWNNATVAQRSDLLHALVSIPRRFDLTIVHSMSRRGGMPADIYASVVKLKPFEFDHLIAFGHALDAIARYLHQKTEPHEIATLIVEDVESMRRFLKRLVYRESRTMPPEHLRDDVTDHSQEVMKEGAFIPASSDRLVDGMHFCKKEESKMLQLADACAFTVQRWINQFTFGESLINSMLGGIPPISDFSGATSFGTWRFSP